MKIEKDLTPFFMQMFCLCCKHTKDPDICKDCKVDYSVSDEAKHIICKATNWEKHPDMNENEVANKINQKIFRERNENENV